VAEWILKYMSGWVDTEIYEWLGGYWNMWVAGWILKYVSGWVDTDSLWMPCKSFEVLPAIQSDYSAMDLW